MAKLLGKGDKCLKKGNIWSAEEMKNFHKVGDVADWAGLEDPVRESWFKLSGCTGEAKLRVIGNICIPEYEMLISIFINLIILQL